MKRNLILLGLVLLAYSAKAQITFASADFLSFYAVGKSHLVYQTDSAKTTMNVGTASRTSQSWILPTIIFKDTTLLTNGPGSAGFGLESPVFPGATHSQTAVYQVPGRTTWHFYYFRITSDSLVKLGEYIYTAAAGNPAPSTSHYFQVGALFPTMWGLSFAWRDSTGDAINYVMTNGTVSLDAYGTITALNGSYECLRSKKQLVRTYYGYLQSPDTTVEFSWLTKEGIFITARALSPSLTSGTIKLGAVSYTMVVSAPAVTVNRENDVPMRFALLHNYPNPFNPSTMIEYELPAAGHARLTVYNALGQEVAVLVNCVQEPGKHTVRFDAGDLASGVYIYRLKSGNFVANGRMTLVR